MFANLLKSTTMINEILDRNARFKKKVADLKEKAPDYPEILIEEEWTTIWGKPMKKFYATTMVSFVYNEIKFKRHHVEEIIETPNIVNGKVLVLEKIKSTAEMCIKHAIPCEYDDVVGPAPKQN
jgi:hypothetical protein